MLAIKEFTTEYRNHPVGIDAAAPRFSWKLDSARFHTVQRSYRMIVKDTADVVWDSGEVSSEQSVAVRYAGSTLEPCSIYEVVLYVTDNHGESAECRSTFETGLMNPANFIADWITHGFEDELEAPAVFNRRFALNEKPVKARLYASALGIYDFCINGRPASDICFAPGWTNYRERIQYQTYDVTELLAENNELSFTAANGWYKGILGFFNQGSHYGSRTALIALLDMTFADGHHERICTDESWDTTTGNVRYSEIYHGETVDMTFEAQEIRPAKRYEQNKDVLTAQGCEPVRITERIGAKKLICTPEGDAVLDFGQNITGVVELHISRPRGTRITIRHAEALDENGNFYTKNLRTAKATDVFVCSGGEDVFRPRFTFHGFRYIAVDGLDPIEPENFTACVMHTDLAKAGEFKCSDERVNRLMQNVDWGLRDNFLDIPTDCPQRDERLGYTGDAQIFLPAAMCCRNVALFFEKWLKDLKTEQALGMGVPTTVPNILGPGGGIAIWHDAAVIVPWKLYETYGDIQFLEEQYESMKACVDFYTERCAEPEKGLILTGQQLGDWVSMDVPRGPMTNYSGETWNLSLNEKMGATDPYFVANAFYANSAFLTSEAAKVLGKSEDAKNYQDLHDNLVRAIRDEFMTPNGRIVNDTQTSNLLALAFGIADGKSRETCIKRLLENLKQHTNHLTTGFAGTAFLCPVLTQNGQHKTAGTVFLKDDCPSWLYQVKLGATTMWELWDGVNPDGSFNPFEMNSLNHYSYGSIGSWVYHDLLGLQMIEPGYRKSRIAPRLISGIPEMEGSIETVYGKLGCSVSCLDGKYTIDLTIPPNMMAVVDLPEREEQVLGSGDYHFEYFTDSSFIPEKYKMDTPFGRLIANPVGRSMLEQYAGELLENEMFMMFAGDRQIEEVISMLPEEIAGLIRTVIKACNEAEHR